jgi:hypothetical protein
LTQFWHDSGKFYSLNARRKLKKCQWILPNDIYFEKFILTEYKNKNFIKIDGRLVSGWRLNFKLKIGLFTGENDIFYNNNIQFSGFSGSPILMQKYIVDVSA